MDIYQYLHKDHQKVAKLMEEVKSTADGMTRVELFETIKSELSLHAETEEKTFYTEIEAKGGKQLQEKEEHAEEEHAEIRDYLKKLSRLNPESAEWMVTFGEFKYAVTHHVEEEEGEIFEKAKKVISDKRAKELALEMDELKQQAKGKKRAA